MIEILSQTLGRARVRVSELKEAQVRGELRLRFEFDVAAPQNVVIDGAPEEDPQKTDWRRGPAVWRLPVSLVQGQELGIEWQSPRSGARLVDVRLATPADDDRPEKFFKDLQAILALHFGKSLVERDRRFFLELDFATTLMRVDYLQRPNMRAAVDVVKIPEEAFSVLPSNIRYYLENIVTMRPFARGHASLAEGDRTALDNLRVSRLDVVESISKIFLALVRKHYSNGSDNWPNESGMAFLRFANGSLRRTTDPEQRRESELARAYNCQPDGYFFLAFAEFALEARNACRAGGPARELEKCWWDQLLRTMIAGLEVFGDVYWDRLDLRRADAYGPEFYQLRRAWSEGELKALLERVLTLPDEALLPRWGRALVSLLMEEPLVDHPET